MRSVSDLKFYKLIIIILPLMGMNCKKVNGEKNIPVEDNHVQSDRKRNPENQKEKIVDKNPDKLYFVTAKTSLRLREKPTTQSISFCNIPEGSVVTVLETTSNREIIDGIEGSWVKIEFCEKLGYVFEGFLCDIYEENCNELNKFISEYTKICPSRCISGKTFEQGDAGSVWREQAILEISSSKVFFISLKYDNQNGNLLSAKKVNDTYFILYEDPINLKILRVRIDKKNKKIYTHAPTDHILKLNEYTTSLIEYSSNNEHLPKILK